MATGTLAQSTLLATTNTTVYTVPADKTAIYGKFSKYRRVYFKCRVAIAASSTPTNAEYIENTLPELASYAVLERTGIVISANKKIVVYSSTGDLVVNVYGYELKQWDDLLQAIHQQSVFQEQ